MPGGEPAGLVEVHGAGRGRVHEPFQHLGDGVRALGVPGEGGQFGGGEGDGGPGLGEGPVGLPAQRPPLGAVAGLAEDVQEIGVGGAAGRREPGPYPAAPLPRHRQVSHDQHERAGQQGLADPAAVSYTHL